MGWARTLLLGDIGNRLDIEDTERDITSVRRELARNRDLDESQDGAIQKLQRENEQLEFCVAALAKALERKGILSTEELTNLARATASRFTVFPISPTTTTSSSPTPRAVSLSSCTGSTNTPPNINLVGVLGFLGVLG